MANIYPGSFFSDLVDSLLPTFSATENGHYWRGPGHMAKGLQITVNSRARGPWSEEEGHFLDQVAWDTRIWVIRPDNCTIVLAQDARPGAHFAASRATMVGRHTSCWREAIGSALARSELLNKIRGAVDHTFSGCQLKYVQLILEKDPNHFRSDALKIKSIGTGTPIYES